MLTYVCPHCREVLSIPERFAGQSGQCKKCGGGITAPRSTPLPFPEHRTPIPGLVRDNAVPTPVRLAAVETRQGMSTARKIAYGLSIAALGVFCLVIFVQGVLPRAQSFSKAVNLALPLLFLILGVAGLYFLGRMLRERLARPDTGALAAWSTGSWLVWGEADHLECPFCGGAVRLNALLGKTKHDFPAPVNPIQPGGASEFTCGHCGAQFPYRYAAGNKSRSGGAVIEWAPRPSATRKHPLR